MTKVQRNWKFCPTKVLFPQLCSYALPHKRVTFHTHLPWYFHGRFLSLPCSSLSFYLDAHETKVTFFSLSTASHHFCLHLAGACFFGTEYWSAMPEKSYRNTLNCHLSRTTLIVKSNIWWEIRWCERWEFRVRSCRKCTRINVVFHWVMTLLKQIGPIV